MRNVSASATIFLVLAISATSQAASVLYSCVTDGGYAANGTACVSSCITFEEQTPYIGIGTPPTDPVEPANNTTWCSTGREYDAEDSNKRKKWGYCDCSPVTASPSVLPTMWESTPEYYADGGGVEEVVQCVFGGIIKSTTGGERTFSTTGCEPITEDFPFNTFRLEEPTNIMTNMSMWCPTVEKYNGKDDASPVSKRKEWGYCLEVATTRNPTANPTTIEPTSAPTEWVFVPITLADGGGVGENAEPDAPGYLPCQFPFTIKNGPEGSEKEYTECISMDYYEPYMQATTTFPVSPSNNATNSSLWCPIIDSKYNKDAAQTPSKRKNWGFCLESMTTRAPVAVPASSPVVTDAPSMAPTEFQSIKYVVGDGGGKNTSTQYAQCVFPFTIKGGPDGDDFEYTSCMNMSHYMPYVSADAEWTGPFDPTNPDTNTMQWCATGLDETNGVGKYNKDAVKTPEKKFDWAYCLQLETTRSPSVSGESTSAPTTSVIAAPTSSASTTSTNLFLAMSMLFFCL